MKGVVKQFRAFFMQYPNSKPRSACVALQLDPKAYGATAQVVKSRTKKRFPRKVVFDGS
jgi:hypothetical protein